MKQFWWKGKQIPRKEYIRCLKNMTRDDLLLCHICMKPFLKISSHEYKPDCECLGNIIVGCG